MRRCGQTRKRDATEGPIVAGLRAYGATVIRLSGKDAPDLLVRYRERWVPLEVKAPGGKVTAGQRAMGYPVVDSLDAALAVIQR